MEYKMTASPSFKGIGLCNQLCLVLNALDQAFQVASNGVGVIIKNNIRHAFYGGKTLEMFPPNGCQWVNNETLLQGYDPQPNTPKPLDIVWKDEAMYPSRYAEGVLVHWMDATPSSVCVYIDKLLTHYCVEDRHKPYSEILDLEAINQSLSPWGVHIRCQDSDTSPNSIYFMRGGYTPRQSLLFQKLIPLLRFHPSFYQKVGSWLSGRQVAHVIHLRNENDAIAHWSSLIGMGQQCFQEKLHDAYKEKIKQHIHKENLTIVLTAFKDNNPIVVWMEQEGYKVDLFRADNWETDRELSAVYDLVLATHCQDLFIGAYRNENAVFGGSTFSFFVSNLLPDRIPRILIDFFDIR
jgi:hypothetical protein